MDFEAVIYNNPVEFPQAINQHALNYQSLRYEMLVILDGFTTFFGTRQKDQESLQDYTRIFKTSYKVLQLLIRSLIRIHKFVKNFNGFKYDLDKQDQLPTNEQLTKQASEQLASFVYLQNAGQSKYGSILQFLNNQKSLNNNQQPITMLEAANVLSNHWYKNVDQTQHQKKGQGQKNDKD